MDGCMGSPLTISTGNRRDLLSPLASPQRSGVGLKFLTSNHALDFDDQPHPEASLINLQRMARDQSQEACWLQL